MFSEKVHFGGLAKRVHNFRSRRDFGNPNGQNLYLCVRNLLLNFKEIQRLTNRGRGFYRSMFSEKTHFGELALAHTFALFRCVLVDFN